MTPQRMVEGDKPTEDKSQKLREDAANMSSTGAMSRAITPSPTASLKRESSKDKHGSESQPHKMRIDNVNFFYGKSHALHDISLGIQSNQVTAFIGPSGCGKSTLLRALNRMHDLIPKTRLEGKIELDGEDIYTPNVDVDSLRRRVGMVFQKSNPFPRSIFDNVAYGVRINNLTKTKAEARRANRKKPARRCPVG